MFPTCRCTVGRWTLILALSYASISVTHKTELESFASNVKAHLANFIPRRRGLITSSSYQRFKGNINCSPLIVNCGPSYSSIVRYKQWPLVMDAVQLSYVLFWALTHWDLHKMAAISQTTTSNRFFALLQLHLHSRLNTWLQWIGQRQL